MIKLKLFFLTATTFLAINSASHGLVCSLQCGSSVGEKAAHLLEALDKEISKENQKRNNECKRRADKCGVDEMALSFSSPSKEQFIAGIKNSPKFKDLTDCFKKCPKNIAKIGDAWRNQYARLQGRTDAGLLVKSLVNALAPHTNN